MKELFLRLWCKFFHIWDDEIPSMILKDDEEWQTHLANSSYQTKFCPLCQKSRFKLKSKISYWEKIFED